jgi:hypothetical protein
MPALHHTDHPHPMVDTVGDIQIPLRVYATSVGPLQASCRGGAAIAIATLVSASDRGHDASDDINTADGMVFGVHDDNVVVMVAPDGLGGSPSGNQSGAAVATVAPFTGTGKGGHDAVGIDFADAVALALTDIGVPLTIHADRPSTHDGGPGGRLPIPDAAFLTIAREGCDNAFPNIEKLVDSLKDLHDLANKPSELQEKAVQCMFEKGLPYTFINSPSLRSLYGLTDETQDPPQDEQQHGEPGVSAQEQDETEKAYGIMDVYTLEAKEPTEADPDPDPMVYAAQHVGNEHIYVKPSARIHVKKDMVVVTFLKSDPYHLLIYEVEDKTADDAVEEYRDLQVSFYRSKRGDAV